MAIIHPNVFHESSSCKAVLCHSMGRFTPDLRPGCRPAIIGLHAETSSLWDLATAGAQLDAFLESGRTVLVPGTGFVQSFVRWVLLKPPLVSGVDDTRVVVIWE